VYDYPGEFLEVSQSQDEARVRQEEEEVPYDIVQGASLCKTLTPGYTFTLESHPDEQAVRGQELKSYLLTSVHHFAAQPGPESGDSGDADYSNSFTCVPSTIQYRPPRVTPKPVVQGVQTAVVVGPAGEEIYTDKYGRVKVQFHWDREGKKDENTSCWIRVSQVHAGKGFGGIDIPRMGEEVVVSFEEGDPDRPLITGRVYHAESMPPFGLPDSKTISGLKSQTYKGDGYNEFVMDDTPGEELIREHAQYNKDTVVENDQTTTVHNNRTTTIDVDDTESVGANQTIDVGADQSLTVGANQTVDIGADQTTEVGANQTESIGATRSITIGANDELAVSGSQKIGVSGPIEISSDTSITLTVGGSTIKIDPASVSIKSATITVEGQAKVETKGALITSQAQGIHEIKGATVKLN
jgi:type VI secretion system secreted protein VgrG